MINLEVGPNREEIIFLVNSGVAHSSLAYHPTALSLSNECLFISGVKGEGFFNVPIFKETQVMYKAQQAQTEFLFVPEPGTNLLGRDLMTKLGIGLPIGHKKIQVSLKLLSTKEEEKILPEVWTREGNLGGLDIPLIQIELKNKGESGGDNTQTH